MSTKGNDKMTLNDAIDMRDDVVVIILGYIRTRSSTDIIMATAPLSPPRAFFHSINKNIGIDYCCHNFSCSICKVDCTLSFWG